ncbi:hypothetical protein ABB28_09485 [Stenotrophomonas chelatiphaga]|uniref:Uncharacterized protein n=1 Tax=Stenotrophomonas chelatiphaga TaxID=517011 RepID=A0A0R0CVC4_9GAMM|nr:hypothetical protein ABB28_09485 [Stenotrophomonas chelatiphaga]
MGDASHKQQAGAAIRRRDIDAGRIEGPKRKCLYDGTHSAVVQPLPDVFRLFGRGVKYDVHIPPQALLHPAEHPQFPTCSSSQARSPSHSLQPAVMDIVSVVEAGLIEMLSYRRQVHGSNQRAA